MTAVMASSGAAVAVGASAAASAAATRAHIRRCEETIHSYDSRTATIAEMQSYSECVEYIHPKPSEFPQSAAIALLVSIVIGVLVGGVVAHVTKDKYDGFGHYFFGVILGAFVGPCILFLGGLFICLVMKAVGVG